MDKKSKCTLDEHKEIEAISFCIECKINMCNKCEKLHFDLFKNRHQNINIKDKNRDEIFSGICIEEKHTELIYFCKNHNKLCCAECITKIKYKKMDSIKIVMYVQLKILKMKKRIN